MNKTYEYYKSGEFVYKVSHEDVYCKVTMIDGSSCWYPAPYKDIVALIKLSNSGITLSGCKPFIKITEQQAFIELL